MTVRRNAFLALLFGALLVVPAFADDVPEEDDEPVPPPPAPAPARPAPPPARPAPPPPPRPAPMPEREPPPPPPRIERDYLSGFYFAPELVALQFEESDTEFSTDATSGRTQSVEADHELGGRLGLGYKWENGWDLIVRGTHVSSSQGETDAETGPAGLATQFGGGFDTAAATLDVEYTTVDIEVGKTWGEWDDHNVRLFFGPRWAAIDQELTAVFDPDDLVAGDRTNTLETAETDGIGARVGVEGHVAFNPNWAFVVSGAVSALNGDFDRRERRTDLDGTVVAFTAASSEDETITAFEGALGFQWQRRAFRDGMFAIRFGWELSLWNDVPSIQDFAGDSGPDFIDDEFRTDGPFVRFEFVF